MADILASVSVQLGMELKGFRAGIAQARKELAGLVQFSQGLKDIGQSMSKYVTVPIVAAGAAAVKVGGDFQAAFNRVEAATQASGAELDSLRKKAQGIALDPNLQFSSVQAAQALEALAKNGASTGDILGGAADATTSLATATGSNLATAADIATDVLNNFGRKASELPGLVSNITGTTIASKLSIDDYRLALGQAGAVAGQLGASFEDFNTALAVTSSGFSSGQDAGTSFKTFMQRLVPQSKEAATAMKELGLNFFDAKGKLLPLRDVAGQLQQAFKGLSDQSKNTFGTKIFGSDAIRTALLLANQGAEGFDKMAASIAKVDAAAQGKIINKGFVGALESLKSSVEGLAQSIADSGVLSFAERLARRGAEIAASLAQASPTALKFGVALAAVAAATGPLLVAIGSLGVALPAISAGLALLSGPVGIAVAAFLALGVGTAAYVASSGASATKSFQEQRSAVGALEKSVSPLLDRYDELKAKTSLSAAEQEEMRSIIQKVGEQIPSAITAFDSYGRAIDISTAAGRRFVEQQQRALTQLNKAALTEQRKEYTRLTNEINLANAALNNKDSSGALVKQVAETRKVGAEFETVVKTVRLTDDEIKALQARLADLRDGRKNVGALIDDLKGIKPPLDAAGAAAETAAVKLAAIAGGLTKEQQDALDKLRKALRDNENASRALGPAYDFVGNKAKILESGIKSLTDVGFKPGGRIVQGYVSDLRSLATAYDQVATKISKGVAPPKVAENPDAFETTKSNLPEQLQTSANLSVLIVQQQAKDMAAAYASMTEAQRTALETAVRRQTDFNTNMEALVDQLNSNVGPLLAGFAGQFGQAFGNVITGAQSAGSALQGLFGGILQSLGGFMKSLGEQLIAIGIGKVSLDKLFAGAGGGPAAIAAGLGLVALAGVATSIGQNAQSSLSGISSGSSTTSSFVPSASVTPREQVIRIINVTQVKGRDLVTISRLEEYRVRKTN